MKLYGNLPRAERSTGHNSLFTYTKAFFGFCDTSACGAQETVTHVLVDCPNPREIRQKLRSELGRLQRRIESAGRLN
jgi:hypothetical protein